MATTQNTSYDHEVTSILLLPWLLSDLPLPAAMALCEILHALLTPNDAHGYIMHAVLVYIQVIC